MSIIEQPKQMIVKSMHINLEANEPHAIQAYDHHTVQINSVLYGQSLIVSRQKIINNLSIKNIDCMDDDYFHLLTQLNPEVIIIGHLETGKFPPIEIITRFAQARIGVECMSLGAACRTYNILLSEQRAVVAGFIF